MVTAKATATVRTPICFHRGQLRSWSAHSSRRRRSRSGAPRRSANHWAPRARMRRTTEPARPPAVPFLLPPPVATTPIVTARAANAPANRIQRKLHVSASQRPLSSARIAADASAARHLPGLPVSGRITRPDHGIPANVGAAPDTSRVMRGLRHDAAMGAKLGAGSTTCSRRTGRRRRPLLRARPGGDRRRRHRVRGVPRRVAPSRRPRVLTPPAGAVPAARAQGAGGGNAPSWVRRPRKSAVDQRSTTRSPAKRMMVMPSSR